MKSLYFGSSNNITNVYADVPTKSLSCLLKKTSLVDPARRLSTGRTQPKRKSDKSSVAAAMLDSVVTTKVSAVNLFGL